MDHDKLHGGTDAVWRRESTFECIFPHLTIPLLFGMLLTRDTLATMSLTPLTANHSFQLSFRNYGLPDLRRWWITISCLVAQMWCRASTFECIFPHLVHYWHNTSTIPL